MVCCPTYATGLNGCCFQDKRLEGVDIDSMLYFYIIKGLAAGGILSIFFFSEMTDSPGHVEEAVKYLDEFTVVAMKENPPQSKLLDVLYASVITAAATTEKVEVVSSFTG